MGFLPEVRLEKSDPHACRREAVEAEANFWEKPGVRQGPRVRAGGRSLTWLGLHVSGDRDLLKPG